MKLHSTEEKIPRLMIKQLSKEHQNRFTILYRKQNMEKGDEKEERKSQTRR